MRTAFFGLALLAAPATAADLAKIDRTLKSEPGYRSAPKYGLVVFGPKAGTRVWLVLDLGQPWENEPDKNVLYVDKNGDGDLTDPGERVACTLRKHETFVSFSPKPAVSYSPEFDVGDIVDRDGKTRHTGLTVRVGSYIQRYRPVSLSVKTDGRNDQFAGGPLLSFADRPEDAPVIHFGGPLTLRVAMESGVLHVPIDYGDKPDLKWSDKYPPTYEQKSLVRGESRELVAQIGTLGLGRGTFATLSAGLPPADVHPFAEIEVPGPDGKPVRLTTRLDSRCCGTLFRGSVTVPAEAGTGKAKVRLSFADWKDGRVAPTTGEVAVTNPVRPAGGGGTKE